MTDDPVIQAAVEAACDSAYVDGELADFPRIVAHAVVAAVRPLIAAEEREACARIVEGKVDPIQKPSTLARNELLWDLAVAIREGKHEGGNE